MLTEKEKIEIQAINRSHEYGLSLTMLERLSEQHQRARISDDTHTMEAIEYRLTDINYHTECGWMARGEYDKVNEYIRKWRF